MEQWNEVGKAIEAGIVEDAGHECLYYAIFEKPTLEKKRELTEIRKLLREIHKR